MPLGLTKNRLVTLAALRREAVSDLLTSRFRSSDLNPDRYAKINSGNRPQGRSPRVRCFSQLGLCNGLFGMLTFFLSSVS